MWDGFDSALVTPLPPKFRMPEMERYTRRGCPCTLLRIHSQFILLDKLGIHLYGRIGLPTPRVQFNIDLPYHLNRLGYQLYILHHTQFTLHRLWRDHLLLILDPKRPQFLHNSLDNSDTLRH